jgi:DNA-binding transcriptional regulator YiaG
MRLREIRKKKGADPVMLAHACSTSLKNFYRWEQNPKKIRGAKLKIIADILHCSIEELLTE